ncbi:response regulator [Clostridium formicaceticum]|uniref:Stage 0 sporulation protein A homolog n=1 Tax=Clostridium formicaceticum TaxID=1497 RepID=A0AAC9WH96_9CLOT|nr:response regulator [Clostridium formicaceticum]AOY77952.1 response regulator [Clostridium formicaceticum]ARE88574.1 Alkaline phosphatase synthesis transcriptional regulatory protein PhoP [Clostridium formicaceticum]
MRKRILIVEDEKNIVLGLRMYLESKGYEVIIAYNGVEAIDKALQTLPHLILLDILLPKMNGYLVCAALKEETALASIPIIFMSAKTEEEDIKKAYEIGGIDYIVKPFTHTQVQEIIEKYI